jgi:hypothetical protein
MASTRLSTSRKLNSMRGRPNLPTSAPYARQRALSSRRSWATIVARLWRARRRSGWRDAIRPQRSQSSSSSGNQGRTHIMLAGVTWHRVQLDFLHIFDQFVVYDTPKSW